MARQSDIDQLAINTIRMLAIDGVQKANSGHPGTPLDAAPTAYVLWQRFLRYDPADPHGPTAIALSFRAGHASMLLYCADPSDRNKGGDPPATSGWIALP